MKSRRTYLPVVIFCLSSLSVFGQFKTVEIESAGISFRLGSDGRMFMADDSAASCHLVGKSDAHFLKYLQLWALGFSNSASYISASLPDKAEFWPGPIDTVSGKAVDPYDWDEVWTISRSEVDQHIRNFSDPNYVPPSGIANWPARHAETNIAPYIAAFADWNGNGIYDPEAGDYPFFKGDRVAYTVSNDEYGEHLHSASGKLQLEQYQNIYTYDEPGLEGIIFGKAVLVNRSDRTYSPLYFGHYVDAELGNRSDNRVRTLVDENLLWFYNGDDDDEGANGFGSSAPVAAILYLDRDITASTAFESGDPVRGIPANAEEIAHCMRGNWKNGTEKYMNGNGTSGGNPTKFSYPGNTDPANTGINWLDEDNSIGAGERRGLINTMSEKLEPGEFITLNFAIILDTGLRSETEIRERAKWAQNRFRTIADVQTFKKSNEDVAVYPNPVKAHSGLHLSGNVEKMQLFDLSGRQLREFVKEDAKASGEMKIPGTELPAEGIYLMRIQTRSETRTARLIIH